MKIISSNSQVVKEQILLLFRFLDRDIFYFFNLISRVFTLLELVDFALVELLHDFPSYPFGHAHRALI